MPKTKIHTESAPAPAGPYSQAIVAGKTVYVAGQGPLDPRTKKLVTGSFEEQAEQTLNNLMEILQAAGCSLDEVVKVTVYLADLNDFPRLNEIYMRYFRDPYPARATVGAQLLFDTKIEMDCIAVRD